MRAIWAVALGIVLAAAAYWWFEVRDAAPAAHDDTPGSTPLESDSRAAKLYRWRDDAGVLQITQTPPAGRHYETVDVNALEQRNVFDPASPAPPAE